MSSQRQVTASRKNAQRSSGPRTREGKARSKRNSWRHGLAVQLASNSPVDPEVVALAAVLAGPSPEPVRWHFAVIAAAAELELRRVDDAYKLRTNSTTAPKDSLRANVQSYGDALTDLLRLQRYKQRAISRRDRALRCL